MTRLIKKYKNRRLYDMSLSAYITIENLRQYVVDNISFQVIDASNNKDMTNISLLQIIVEQESAASCLLSESILRQVIRLSAHPLHKQFSAILEQNMQTFETFNAQNLYTKTMDD